MSFGWYMDCLLLSPPTVRRSPRAYQQLLAQLLRTRVDSSWPSERTAFPAVADPALSDQPPYDDDHIREGNPEVHHPAPPLRAPHELLVGVVPGTRPLHHPALRCPKW